MCFDSKDQTSSQTTQYPAYISNALQNSFATAQNAANTPYVSYPGQTVAPFSDLQTAAFSALPGIASAANPYINAASALTSQGTQPVNLMPWSQNAVQKYFNPYTQDVIDKTQNQFNLQNGQQQNALKGNAAASRALGGDREAIMAASLAGQQQTAQAPVIAGLYNQNWQQANQQFNLQQQTDLASQQANRYIDLYGAGQMGNLGQLAQGTGLAGVGAMLQAGGLQQQQMQNYLNVPWNEWNAARQWPFYTSGFLSSATTGAANPYQGNVTRTTPGPSLAGQLAGLGTTFAGLGGFSSNTDLPLGGVFFKDGGEVGKMRQGGGLADYDQGGSTFNGVTVRDLPVAQFGPSDISYMAPQLPQVLGHDPTAMDWARAGANVGGWFIPPLGAISSLFNFGEGVVKGFDSKTDPTGYAKSDTGVPTFTENNFLNKALSGSNSVSGGLGSLIGRGAGWFANQFGSGYSPNQVQEVPVSLPSYGNIEVPQAPLDWDAPATSFNNYSPSPSPSASFNDYNPSPTQNQWQPAQFDYSIQPSEVSTPALNQQELLSYLPHITPEFDQNTGWVGQQDYLATNPFSMTGDMWPNFMQGATFGGGRFDDSPALGGFFGAGGMGGGGWGGGVDPDAPNGGWGSKRGGSIGSFADGGEFMIDEDADGQDDWLMQDDDEQALSNDTRFLSQMGGVASAPPPARVPAPDGLDPEGNPMQQMPVPARPQVAKRPGGIDAQHQALIAAGLGMMSAPGDFLSGVGKGGLMGLNAFQKARTEERQQDALDANEAYRTVMSQAALRRAEAMAQHYDNVDSKPIFDRTGPNLRIYHPNTKELVDTGLPNTLVQERVRANNIAAQNAANAGRETFQWQSGTQNGVEGMFRLSTKGGGAPVFIPNSSLTGRGGAGGRGKGATQALVDALIKEGTAKNTQEALTIIRDPGSRYGHQVNSTLERLASGAAKVDPEFGDDPTAITAKWRQYYGLPDKPQAVQIPVPGAKPASAPAPAVAARPAGVPPGAQYSPSQKKWWWKDGKGAWQTN